MSMVSIEREGSKITIWADVPGTGTRFPFSFFAPNEWSAILLASALREALYSSMRSIRADAYERGWKDAKSRQKKADWHSAQLP